ncbi:phospholipid-transporting ATPase ABCA3 isoform X2 [Anabrus simplex]|uniref:phospholipid-transporting ATPase ABCA3 isoform X2 n=1 Tax=Anabrus simplex TaxID=316456 RepID=UPI0035A2BDF2
MARGVTKFVLLMWKNWLLQSRHKIQTAVEILIPVLFSGLIVIIRSLIESGEISDPTLFTPFNPIQEYKDRLISPPYGFQRSISPSIAWCMEENEAGDYRDWLENEVANYIENRIFYGIIKFRKYDSEQAMVNELLDTSKSMMNSTLAGVVFEGSSVKCSGDIKVRLRFPGELRSNGKPSPYVNWQSNLLFPVYQFPGPRSPSENQTIGDASPGYQFEGFLPLQEAISTALIETCPSTNSMQTVNLLLHRFPYPPYLKDALLRALQVFISLMIMLSFVYTCISTVKVITAEKEKQLKEAMKIMGLPSWLHWLAWFIKTLIFLLISTVLIVILLKVKWYPGTDLAVFTNSDGTLVFVLMLLYMIASICFCFMISVFFSKANTAATIAGVAWFLSYAPYMFMQQDYENTPLTSKVMACLASNTAMAYGFQLLIMFEGTGVGLQWDDIWSPASQDDDLVIGYILLMLILDSFIYLLITVYVEAVFPGDYGVPKPWYFFLQKSFWCGVSQKKFNNSTSDTKQSSTYEKEPSHLPVGIEIKNLTKVFDKTKKAVNNLSLNMFEGQITVLLGHNGAGKTTTMSMLTGLYTPTSGTAVIGGYDIITEIDNVRDSLGLCPQHNILFDELTVREHLYFFGKLKGLEGDELEKEITKYIGLLQLEPKENAPSKTLSGGMKRKLSAGVALCGRSKVVMFDEPTSGMDPAARRAMWDLLQAEKTGRTILLTTHFMDEADLLGDRIAIMAGGELQCCGSSFFLKKKYGAGYHLVIVKGSTCDVDAVTGLLQRHIPSITVSQNIGSELSYLLSEDQSALFEKMFHDLEENKRNIGILSYGVSLTTMEEVFMKVGKDQDVTMEDGNYVSGTTNLAFSPSTDDGYIGAYSGQTKVNIQEPMLLSGAELVANQLFAMLIKKALHSAREWGLLIIQIILPVFFMIIALIVAKSWESSKDLPALDIDLKAYEDPYTLVAAEKNTHPLIDDLYSSFTRIASANTIYLGNTADVSEYMSDYFLNKSESQLNLVSQNYIVGGSFELNTGSGKVNAIGWFNGQPYHSPPLALSLIVNALLSAINSNISSISVTNHPLPYTAESQASIQMNGNNVGFQIAFNIGFSMSFVAAYFVMFPIKERISKSKHLQFVSGVEVLSFWFVSLAWDGIIFLLPALGLIITLASFQEESFSTFEELGRVFLILMFFGWAMLPYTYLFSYLFSLPATGYTRMSMLNIFGGVAAFMVVTILAAPGIDLKYISDALEWVLMILPHYSLSKSVHKLNMNYQYLKICKDVLPICATLNETSQPNICCPGHCPESSGCLEFTEDYFSFEAPGIGRNLIYFIIAGCCFMILLVLIEYRVFEPRHARKAKLQPQANGNDSSDLQDSDVREEREKIKNGNLELLMKEYSLILKDFTKYYGNFLAVNHLSVGVRKGECFGLLGINGAGKTSTFKMLTGDERISEGDGFVNGLSLSKEMKEVHQLIGYCPQFDALIDNLTGRETLIMFCLLRGIRRKECEYIVNKLADELLFAKHIDKKVKEYSGGNKRKLSTAVALVGDPPIVYLDEPTTGMDPVAKRHLWNVICKVRDSGRCIILTSHSMEECEALCTRIAIMVNGNFKCLGSAQHLKSKFAEGYTLSIKVKKSPKESTLSLTSVDFDPSELQPVKDFVTNSFPGATLREEYQGLLTYYINNNNLTWARMFGLMEAAKQQLSIEDYSLGQTSLEQVFLTFTKTQREIS